VRRKPRRGIARWQELRQRPGMGVAGISPLEIPMTLSALVRLLQSNGFGLLKENGSVRYYQKPGVDRLIRVDCHGSKAVPTGTFHAIARTAGVRIGGRS